MDQIREMVQPLYDSGDLLGFAICGDAGEIVHNESFFSDEMAWQAVAPFVNVVRQMKKSGRDINRLTVELEDVTLIYGQLEQGHALFTLGRDCDLDAAAAVLS
ncbi:MAG: hypothetical protein KJO79_09605 [Verrucomicrobiae bacterium]|nr:hypothetical protein [Verrucomicrobiae bacterium]NNJ87426.1 hypothetical protein [Akkermansiaceae bacterium]